MDILKSIGRLRNDDFYLHKLQDLQQTTTVEIYEQQFNLLMSQVAAKYRHLDESYFVACCIHGFTKEIQEVVQLCSPSSVECCFKIAFMKETLLNIVASSRPKPSVSNKVIASAHINQNSSIFPSIPNMQTVCNSNDIISIDMVESVEDDESVIDQGTEAFLDSNSDLSQNLVVQNLSDSSDPITTTVRNLCGMDSQLAKDNVHGDSALIHESELRALRREWSLLWYKSFIIINQSEILLAFKGGTCTLVTLSYLDSCFLESAKKPSPTNALILTARSVLLILVGSILYNVGVLKFKDKNMEIQGDDDLTRELYSWWVGQKNHQAAKKMCALCNMTVHLTEGLSKQLVHQGSVLGVLLCALHPVGLAVVKVILNVHRILGLRKSLEKTGTWGSIVEKGKHVHLDSGYYVCATLHLIFSWDPGPSILAFHISNYMSLGAEVKATLEFLNTTGQGVMVGGLLLGVEKTSDAFAVALLPSGRGPLLNSFQGMYSTVHWWGFPYNVGGFTWINEVQQLWPCLFKQHDVVSSSLLCRVFQYSGPIKLKVQVKTAELCLLDAAHMFSPEILETVKQGRPHSPFSKVRHKAAPGCRQGPWVVILYVGLSRIAYRTLAAEDTLFSDILGQKTIPARRPCEYTTLPQGCMLTLSHRDLSFKLHVFEIKQCSSESVLVTDIQIDIVMSDFTYLYKEDKHVFCESVLGTLVSSGAGGYCGDDSRHSVVTAPDVHNSIKHVHVVNQYKSPGIIFTRDIVNTSQQQFIMNNSKIIASSGYVVQIQDGACLIQGIPMHVHGFIQLRNLDKEAYTCVLVMCQTGQYILNCLTKIIAAGLQADDAFEFRLNGYVVALNYNAVMTFQIWATLQCHLQVVIVALVLTSDVVNTDISSDMSTNYFYNLEVCSKCAYNGLRLLYFSLFISNMCSLQPLLLYSITTIDVQEPDESKMLTHCFSKTAICTVNATDDNSSLSKTLHSLFEDLQSISTASGGYSPCLVFAAMSVAIGARYIICYDPGKSIATMLFAVVGNLVSQLWHIAWSLGFLSYLRNSVCAIYVTSVAFCELCNFLSVLPHLSSPSNASEGQQLDGALQSNSRDGIKTESKVQNFSIAGTSASTFSLRP